MQDRKAVFDREETAIKSYSGVDTVVLVSSESYSSILILPLSNNSSRITHIILVLNDNNT
nr:10656_t:CDS:2 [Entrophospora candida]